MSPISVDDIANQTMDVIPAVMRAIRSKFREQRAADLSVAQFRTLAFIDARDGASLSDTAGHIGLTLPSMSKMVDGLVSRKLVNRETHSSDRRRICLSLTDLGKKELQAAYAHTHEYLVTKLASLSESEQESIQQAFAVLRGLFSSEHKLESEPGEKTA